eukprot:5934459-Lingulodinium_polyedra.AAC.1
MPTKACRGLRCSAIKANRTVMAMERDRVPGHPHRLGSTMQDQTAENESEKSWRVELWAA